MRQGRKKLGRELEFRGMQVVACSLIIGRSTQVADAVMMGDPLTMSDTGRYVVMVLKGWMPAILLTCAHV